jgi:hypothetical protein
MFQDKGCLKCIKIQPYSNFSRRGNPRTGKYLNFCIACMIELYKEYPDLKWKDEFFKYITNIRENAPLSYERIINRRF